MIAIVDYGMGNLMNVQKAIEYVGGNPKITNSKKDMENAKAIVLPGVGAFKDAMDNLKNSGLKEAIVREVERGKPFLGICLGLQLLFEESHEFGMHGGFGILSGDVVKFNLPENYKVPHMGWNQIHKLKRSRLLNGIPDGAFFYFVHSYYVRPRDESVKLTETDYGVDFTSSIEYENLFATQFHPEKSQRNGLKLLSNFLRIVEES